jgi:hypothetical protein
MAFDFAQLADTEPVATEEPTPVAQGKGFDFAKLADTPQVDQEPTAAPVVGQVVAPEPKPNGFDFSQLAAPAPAPSPQAESFKRGLRDRAKPLPGRRVDAGLPTTAATTDPQPSVTVTPPTVTEPGEVAPQPSGVLARAGEAAKSFGKLHADTLRSVAQGAAETTAGFLRGGQEAITGRGLGKAGLVLPTAIPARIAEAVFGDPTKFISSKLKSFARDIAPKMEGTEGIVANFKEKNFTEAGRQMLLGLARNLPQIAAVAAAPSAGLPVLGVAAAGGKLDELERQNPDINPIVARMNAAASGIIEAYAEQLGTGKILKRIQNKTALMGGFKAALTEVLIGAGLEAREEVVAGIADNALDMLTQQKKATIGGLFDGVPDAAIIGALSGGGLGTISAGSGQAQAPTDQAPTQPAAEPQAPSTKTMDALLAEGAPGVEQGAEPGVVQTTGGIVDDALRRFDAGDISVEDVADILRDDPSAPAYATEALKQYEDEYFTQLRETGLRMDDVAGDNFIGMLRNKPKGPATQLQPAQLPPSDFELKGAHMSQVQTAINRGEPVNAQAVDTYNLKDRTPGWTQQGDLLVPPPTTPAESVAEQGPTPQEIFTRGQQIGAELAQRPAATQGGSEIGIADELPPSDRGETFERTFDENEQALSDTLKKSKEPFLAKMKRLFVDQNATAKDALLKAGAKDSVIGKVLEGGASSEAERVYKGAMSDIKAALPRGQMKNLAQFIDATRTIEAEGLQAERGKSLRSRQGVTAEGSQRWLDNFRETASPETVAAVEAAAQTYWDTMRSQLDSLRDAGLVSQEAYDSLVANHRNYSPRLFVDFIDPQTVGAKGSRQHDSGIKALDEGSERAMATDPAFLLAHVVSRTQNRIFRNRANQELLNFAQANPDQALARVLPEGVQPRNNEQVVDVFVDGQKQQVAMPTKMAEQWNGLPPALSRDVATMLSWGSGAKPLKFLATGANPEFAFSNLARDIAFAWFNSGQYSNFMPKAAIQMVADYAGIGKDAVLRRGAYNDYIKEGGGMDFLTTQGRPTGATTDISPTKFGKLRRTVAAGLRPAVDILAYLGETSEVATRLAVRNRALKNGLSPTEATHAARSMLDFSQGGRASKVLDQFVPYFNAAIQGTRGTVRAFKTDPVGSSFKASQLAVLGAALAAAARAYDDEAWDSISDREKATKWIIPLGVAKSDKEGNKRHMYLSIPKDQFQQIFAAAGQSFVDGVAGKPWSRQMINAITSLLPVELASIIPPGPNSVITYFFNYDTWKQRRVWEGYSNISPTNERRVTTPEIANRVSDVAAKMGVQLSPERLSAATSKVVPMSNPVAAMLVNLGDLAKDQQTADTLVEEVRKIPGARRFVRFSHPSSVDEKTQKKAEQLGVDTAGKIRSTVRREVVEAERLQNDSRQKRNLELDGFMSGGTVDGAELKTWLSTNVQTPSERKRLWNRAKLKRPDLITGGFGGSSRRRRTRRTRQRRTR